MKNPKKALIWITDILKRYHIPFQISGGLAARAYGATRDLEDIDIDIPDNCFDLIKDELKEYIIFGPERFKDGNWDLLLMTLDYNDQPIDLSGAHQTKIFDSHTKCWHLLQTDFSKVEIKNLFGLNFPIIPRHELIAYKQMLGREVDISDVDALLKAKG